MEAEKHVMRAQLRDLIDKQRTEVQRLTEQHQAQMAQTQQDLLGQLEELRRASISAPAANQEASGSGNVPMDAASIQRIAELEGWCFFLTLIIHCSRKNREEVSQELEMVNSWTPFDFYTLSDRKSSFGFIKTV